MPDTPDTTDTPAEVPSEPEAEPETEPTAEPEAKPGAATATLEKLTLEVPAITVNVRDRTFTMSAFEMMVLMDNLHSAIGKMHLISAISGGQITAGAANIQPTSACMLELLQCIGIVASEHCPECQHYHLNFSSQETADMCGEVVGAVSEVLQLDSITMLMEGRLL